MSAEKKRKPVIDEYDKCPDCGATDQCEHSAESGPGDHVELKFQCYECGYTWKAVNGKIVVDT